MEDPVIEDLEQRKFEDFYIITANKAQCLLCEDIIESTHRHDFVKCKCGEIFTDGGRDYLRRGAYSFKNLRDLSENRVMTEEELDTYIANNTDMGSVYGNPFKEWREERLANAREFKKLMYGK